MKTVIVEILKDGALNLLKDLEAMNIIRIHNLNEKKSAQNIALKSLKGVMTKQPIEEVDKQLDELRGR